jgi:hypothetical protein
MGGSFVRVEKRPVARSRLARDFRFECGGLVALSGGERSPGELSCGGVDDADDGARDDEPAAGPAAGAVDAVLVLQTFATQRDSVGGVDAVDTDELAGMSPCGFAVRSSAGSVNDGYWT